jgi:hypothetical protein
MSPERFAFARSGGNLKEAPAPAASDVFALGCVLAEMCSGNKLVCEPLTEEDCGGAASLALKGYRGLDPAFRRSYACEAIVKNPPFLSRRIDGALANVDPPLAEIIRAMLHVRGDSRPSAGDVADRLAAIR